MPTRPKKSYDTVQQAYEATIRPLLIHLEQNMSRFDEYFNIHERSDVLWRSDFEQIWRYRIEEHSAIELPMFWTQLRLYPKKNFRIDVLFRIYFHMWQYSIECSIPGFQTKEVAYNEKIYLLHARELCTEIGGYVFSELKTQMDITS